MLVRDLFSRLEQFDDLRISALKLLFRNWVYRIINSVLITELLFIQQFSLVTGEFLRDDLGSLWVERERRRGNLPAPLPKTLLNEPRRHGLVHHREGQRLRSEIDRETRFQYNSSKGAGYARESSALSSPRRAPVW